MKDILCLALCFTCDAFLNCLCSHSESPSRVEGVKPDGPQEGFNGSKNVSVAIEHDLSCLVDVVCRLHTVYYTGWPKNTDFALINRYLFHLAG